MGNCRAPHGQTACAVLANLLGEEKGDEQFSNPVPLVMVSFDKFNRLKQVTLNLPKVFGAAIHLNAGYSKGQLDAIVALVNEKMRSAVEPQRFAL